MQIASKCRNDVALPFWYKRSSSSSSWSSTAAAAGVEPYSAGMATFARETLDYHAHLIKLAGDRAAGTVNPDEPLPAGPTTAARTR